MMATLNIAWTREKNFTNCHVRLTKPRCVYNGSANLPVVFAATETTWNGYSSLSESTVAVYSGAFLILLGRTGLFADNMALFSLRRGC
jgi:hypothetical protein